ncbi:hypothetical protein PENVUL_c012G09411 [Penicillium vulpinum]|uniref:Uncharacterized protein n=2 Tax=Penicillium vulpinum TaxID=29845 RepID=A0A1V6S2F4_9EURO|nr:hypothetical protein PENVUL_c012G09411 [Penicillium vulpinum]
MARTHFNVKWNEHRERTSAFRAKYKYCHGIPERVLAMLNYAIWRLFNCKELGLNLGTMRLEYYDGQVHENIDLNTWEELWEDLRDIMSNPENSNFKFTGTMESFDRIGFYDGFYIQDLAAREAERHGRRD